MAELCKTCGGKGSVPEDEPGNCQPPWTDCEKCLGSGVKDGPNINGHYFVYGQCRNCRSKAVDASNVCQKGQ
jgi:hypothetical protein